MHIQKFHLSSRRKAVRFEHGLDPESVDECYEQLGLALGIEVWWKLGSGLGCRHDVLEEPAPDHVASALFDGEFSTRNRLAPEGKPDSPLVATTLVERKPFLGDRAQGLTAFFTRVHLEHSQTSFVRRVAKRVDHHLTLVAKVVDERASRATGLIGDGA